jgi:predicted RNA-binding protein with EMAP domain
VPDTESSSLAKQQNVFRHSYRALSQTELADIEDIKDLAAQMWDLIDALGNTREFSVAKTKLEEVVFWAVKGIT